MNPHRTATSLIDRTASLVEQLAWTALAELDLVDPDKKLFRVRRLVRRAMTMRESIVLLGDAARELEAGGE